MTALVALDLAAARVLLRRSVAGNLRAVVLGRGLARYLREGWPMCVLFCATRLMLQDVINATMRYLVLAVHVVRMCHVRIPTFCMD
jgi:hypothetical protein